MVEITYSKDKLIENLNELILVLDDKFIIEYINKSSYIEKLGYSREELIGKIGIYFFHPDDHRIILKRTRQLNKKGEILIDGRVKHKSGTYFWFEVRGITFKDDNGNFKYLFTLRDITDRKITEEKLKESEKKFRLLAENSNEVLWTSDLNNKLQNISAAVENVLGYTTKEMMELSASIYTPSNSREIVKNIFNQFLKSDEEKRDLKRIARFEIEQIHKNGHSMYVEITATLLRDPKGIPIGFLGVTRDITDRKKVIIQLRESEEKFRTISEQSLMGICIVQDNKIKYINKQLANSFGYSIEEIYKFPVGEFMKVIHPNYIDLAKEQLEKKQKGHLDILPRYQIQGIRKSGDVFWIDNFSKTIIYKGKPADLVFQIDISEQKLAERKLLESENKLRDFAKELEQKVETRTKELQKSQELLQRKSDEQSLLLDNIETQVWYLINENTYGAVNKAYAKFLGIEQEDLELQKIIDVRTGTEVSKCLTGNREVFEKKKQYRAEEWISNKNGEKRLFSIIKTPRLAADGNVEYVVCAAEDITERKLVEDKLRESEERFRTMAEQSLMGIAIVQDGFLRYCNEAMIKIGEYTWETIKSWKKFELKKLFHPDDFLFLMNNLVETTKMKDIGLDQVLRPAHLTFKLITKFKKVKHIEAFIKIISYKRKPALLITMLDITDKKKFEEGLIESERKLRAQNLELKKLDTLKSDFITIAAHELKTPLISIIGYLDLILTKNQDLEQEILEDLGRVLSNSKRLEIYIEQLMDVMRIDAKKIELDLTPENIYDIIVNCMSELSFQLKQRNIDIQLFIEHDFTLLVDKFRISQVFSNLLSNAVKFSKEGSKITVSVEKKHGSFIFKIKDFGLGLTKYEIDQLFGKFVMINRNIETYSNLERGSGLGLYITKGIVEAHGGRIWAQSKGKHRGAEFLFSIPK